MNYFQSMLQTLGRCVTLLVQQQPGLFGWTLLAGVVLAALCWWAATHYSRLFNLTFQITRIHQILCAVAALLTLVFCVLFVSLKFTRQIAEEAIETWNRTVSDSNWRYPVGVKAYYAIKAIGEEDFSKYPPPEGGGRIVMPMNKPSSIRAAASLLANAALHLFKTTNPFLSHVLSLPARIPDSVIYNDIYAFGVRNPNGTYALERAFELTAAQIKGRLDPETPKAVLDARLILTACFLLAQGVPFLWIGLAAYRDLKVQV